MKHLVMRKWELIKQSKLLVIKSKILSNLLNEKHGLKLGEFNNTTGTERVNIILFFLLSIVCHCNIKSEHSLTPKTFGVRSIFL